MLKLKDACLFCQYSQGYIKLKKSAKMLLELQLSEKSETRMTDRWGKRGN